MCVYKSYLLYLLIHYWTWIVSRSWLLNDAGNIGRYIYLFPDLFSEKKSLLFVFFPQIVRNPFLLCFFLGMSVFSVLLLSQFLVYTVDDRKRDRLISLSLKCIF